MARDFLNVIERALMMGVSDKLNDPAQGGTDAGSDIYVFGQFPEQEEMQFPSVVVQLVNSGFEENFFGDNVTFGSTSNNTSSGSGEVYGVTFLFHIFVDKDTEISITSTPNKTGSAATTVYRQRKLINWLMLNIANAVMSIDWDQYEEDELEILERHLEQWRDIGFMPQAQWYGATAEFTLAFLNLR
jgi:hypothetical protein